MKILLVDDNENWRFVFKEELANVFKTAEFVEVTSGEEALELIFGGFYPDLIFIDSWIPGMGGIRLIKEIRANPEPKISGLRIIYFTDDYDIPEYHEMAKELGCGFLSKTADPGSIIETIKATIQEAV